MIDTKPKTDKKQRTKYDYMFSKSERQPSRCGCGGIVKSERDKTKNMVRAFCHQCGMTTDWEKTLWDASLSWEKQTIHQGERK